MCVDDDSAFFCGDGKEVVEREIFFSVSMTRAIYIYSEREREREGERERETMLWKISISQVFQFSVSLYHFCAPASKVRSEQELCFVQPSHIKEILEN